ncbi:MAG: SCO family protein [Candidatus Thermoplasmatota archaeon]|nr:SCO family protein [Candidatus Thermoplasmatota archaeon]
MQKWMALFLALCILLPGCTSPKSDELDVFYGDDLPGDDAEYSVEEFTLYDAEGNQTNLSDYAGQVLIVSFVYTRCPDVCPIVSSNLRWVSQNLSDDYGTNFSIISITVDPWWDSQNVLHDYSVLRSLDWPHLTGGVDVLEPIWEDFHVGLTTYVNESYENENETQGRHHPDYLVDHSTATIILDKEHRQRVRWNDLDWEVTLFANDVQQLLDE